MKVTKIGCAGEAGERSAWLRRTSLEEHSGRGSTGDTQDSILLGHKLVAVAMGAGLLLTGTYSKGVRNALNLVVRRLAVEFADLPPEFDGFRILHLADLHIDGVEGLTEAIASMVLGRDCDLCVMTGDYRFQVQGSCDAVYPRLRTIIGNVRARYGVVGILGNHDTLEMAFELEKCGVRMLINEPIEISG